uniref:Zinc finger protein n=1 Tax=Ciona intestinalis TaxID=7719 RepID=F6T7F9_CIOIN
MVKTNYPDSDSKLFVMKNMKLKKRETSNVVRPISTSRLERPASSDSNSSDVKTVASWREIIKPSAFVKELNPKFLCVECKYTLEFPVALSNCEHHACSQCVSRLWKISRSCPLDGKVIDRNEVTIDEKLQIELNNLNMVCPYKHCGCHWEGMFFDFKSHYDECLYTEEVCSNDCGFRCSKHLMDNHLQIECSKRLVVCEFCALHLKAENEIEHLKSCIRFPVTCPKKCGTKEIPREELNAHLELDCQLADKVCPYETVGCTFTCSREKMATHVDECFRKHVSLLCDGFRKQAELLGLQKKQLFEHKQILHDHGKMITKVGREFDSQLLWKISEWSSKKIEAEAGKRTVLQSPLFYSARFQYKLAVLLLPNGDGKAKGTHLSIYVRLCKGEYDALLSWPYRLPIEISLIDQSQDPRARINHTYSLRPNPCKENKPFLGRPTSESNPSFGSQTFMPLDTLNTRDYIRDDAIFIRVSVLHDET